MCFFKKRILKRAHLKHDGTQPVIKEVLINLCIKLSTQGSEAVGDERGPNS